MALARPISTRNKVYASVLGVAFAALAYDQCRSSGPTRAKAAVVSPAGTAGTFAPVAAVPPGNAPAAPIAPTSDLASRLRVLWGGADPPTDSRDPFVPSADWAAERRAVADAAAFPTAEAFAAAHKLTVVLLPAGGGVGAAVIGGRLVRVGQALDGYRLTAVTPRSVRLAGTGGAIDLRMP